MTLRINSRRRVSAVKLRSVQPWVLSLRIIEKYLDPVEEPLQNRLEFENRGHFAPGWNLARHNSSTTVTKTVTVTKKKANLKRLAFSYLIDSLDWCGGGDLNPYALRR